MVEASRPTLGQVCWSCRCGWCGQMWRDQFPTPVDAEMFLRGHQAWCMPSHCHPTAPQAPDEADAEEDVCP